MGKSKEQRLRPVLDLPIKDPIQDFAYSSTEDEYDGDGTRIFKSSSAAMRKYPISATVSGDVLNIKMPPELIITSAVVSGGLQDTRRDVYYYIIYN